jgi:outer membrane protein TolC
MKKIIIVMMLFLCGLSALAQEIFTLDSCLNLSVQNYPLIRNEWHIQHKADLNKKVINSGYYPSIGFVGQATWQSEVTNIELDVPFFTEPIVDVAQDQYKLALDISQVIWDGGAMLKSENLNRQNAVVEQTKLQTDIYAYKEQVINLYYSLLALRKQEEVYTVKRWQLRERQKELESALKNGLILPAQLDVLMAETISIEQQIMDVQYESKAIQEMLEYFMGASISEFANILLPAPEISANISIVRPEMDYFSALKQQALASQKLLSVSRMPRISAFTQLGYGRPGLNMLSNEFSPYAIVGARLIWTPWDWNKTKNKREVVNVQLQILDVQQQQFEFIQHAKANAQWQRIEKLEKLIEKDEELLAVRKRITASFASQLQNGVVTAGEYVIALNDEQSALLGMAMHEILLSRAQVEYELIIGTLNK